MSETRTNNFFFYTSVGLLSEMVFNPRLSNVWDCHWPSLSLDESDLVRLIGDRPSLGLSTLYSQSDDSWGIILNLWRFDGGATMVIAFFPDPTLSVLFLRKLLVGISTPKSTVSVVVWLNPGVTILMFEAMFMCVCCVNTLGNSGRMIAVFFILCTDVLRLMVMRDIIVTVRLSFCFFFVNLRPSMKVVNKISYSNSSWAVIFLRPGGAQTIMKVKTAVTAKIALNVRVQKDDFSALDRPDQE